MPCIADPLSWGTTDYLPRGCPAGRGTREQSRVTNEPETRARRVARRMTDRIRQRGRVRTILRGPAAGLLISAGPASADYAEGVNEEPVQAALTRWLRPGDTFLDIGANVGFFSLLGARLVGPSGRVIAFEPVDHLAVAARRNAHLNGFDQIEVHTVGVGVEPGRAPLSITDHPGGATLASDVDFDEVTEIVEVPVVSISSMVQDGSIPHPDVTKIDVEGHELAVLRGMTVVLEARHSTLLIELDAENVGELDAKSTAVEHLLGRYGYTVNRLPDAYVGIDRSVLHLCATPL